MVFIGVNEMQKLLDDFNRFFKEQANAVIVNGRLQITINSITMVISLPEYTGGRNDSTA